MNSKLGIMKRQMKSPSRKNQSTTNLLNSDFQNDYYTKQV